MQVLETSGDAQPTGSAEHTLVALFDRAASRHGHRVAFCEGEITVSFREIERRSLVLAACLQNQLGIAQGDRVAIMLRNGVAFPVAAIGVLRCGGVLVNVNPFYTERELAHQLSDSGAVAIIADGAAMASLAAVLGNTSVRTLIQIGISAPDSQPSHDVVRLLSWDAIMAADWPQPMVAPAISPDDIALLQYTGGTTGLSKGAVLHHRNICANRDQICEALGLDSAGSQHNVLTVLPLYHIFAFTVNFVTMYSLGATNVLVREPSNFESVMDALSGNPISFMTGVNTLYASIAAHPCAAEVDWSPLTFAIGGGSAILPATSARWRDLTGHHILEGLGMTETSPVMTVNPPGRPGFSGTVGLPLPGTEIVLVGDDDHPCPVGKPGEICVRGPQLMSGYWGHRANADAAFTADGYFRTGDIGLFDEDGFLKIVDRKKDMILVSGFNVYPNEVEAVASEFVGVIECACVGVLDDRSGEAVKIYLAVQQPDHFDTSGFLRHCRERLAAYKVPRQVAFMDALPKSAVGKILRRELGRA